MDTNCFLEDEQRYQLLIVEFASLKSNGETLSIFFLQEFLGLSEYKIQNLVDKTNREWLQLFNQELLTKDAKNFIIAYAISNDELNKIKSFLLDQSLYFRLFRTLLLNQSFKSFRIDNYMSASKSYDVLNKVTDILKSFDVSIERERLIGNEPQLRLLAFQLLFLVFYEGKFSFDSEVKQVSMDLYWFLESVFNWSITPLEKAKIELYLSIVVIRTQENPRSMPLIDVTIPESLQMNLLKTKWPYSQEELHYLLLFLFSQDLLSVIIINDHDISSLTEIRQVNFERAFHRFFHTTNHAPFLQPDFKNEFTRIMVRYHYFPIIFQTFDSRNKRSIFHNLLMKYDQFVLHVLEDLMTEPEELKISLYYDLVLLLYHFFSVADFEPVIYICVNFSRGRLYSSFIADNIISFNILPIQIEYKVSNNTDIYISDFKHQKFPRNQVVWKNPPDANDWQNFGDLLTKVRKEKNEKNVL